VRRSRGTAVLRRSQHCWRVARLTDSTFATVRVIHDGTRIVFNFRPLATVSISISRQRDVFLEPRFEPIPAAPCRSVLHRASRPL